MLTYIGRGYSPAFSLRMTQVLRRLQGGGSVKIAAGPDAICAGNRGGAAGRHCRSASVRARDQRAAQDLQRLRLAPIRDGARLHLPPALIARMRAAYMRGASRSACAGCAWKGLCDTVAARGFAGCVLPTAFSQARRRGNTA